MLEKHYRGRFAPSPSGPLHAGSLLAALGSWLLARQVGGQWLLRIEDIDPPREVAGAAQQQLATLAAFGLQHDGDILQQSQRHAFYQAALEQLLASGHAFECHCSRSEVAATGGLHRHCVAMRPRPDPAIRFRVPDGCHVRIHDAIHGEITQLIDREVGDFVLRRSDGLWAYQLAVVVDDAAQGITHVVRGADLLDSTPRQWLLQQALGLPTPHYTHLPLILGSDGKKLSKSNAALPVETKAPVRTLMQLWHCLGQPALPTASTVSVQTFLQAASATFRLQAVPTLALPLSAAMHNTNDTPCA